MKKIPIKQTKSEDGRMITSILGGLFKQVFSEYEKEYYFCNLKLWKNKDDAQKIVHSEIKKLRYENTIQQIESLITQATEELNLKLQELDKNITTIKAEFANTLDRQEQKFSKDLNAIKIEMVSIHQAENERMQQLQSNIDDVEKALQCADKELSQNITSLENKVLDLNKKTEENLAALRTKSEKTTEDLQKQLTTVKNETDEKVATLKNTDEELSAKLTEFKENTNKTLTDLHTTDNSLQQKIDKAKEELTQADNNLSQNIIGLENKVLDLNKNIEDKVINLQQETSDTIAKLKVADETLAEQISAVKSISENQANELKIVDAKIKEDIISFKGKVSQNVDELIASDNKLEGKIANIKTTLENADKELSQKILDNNNKLDIVNNFVRTSTSIKFNDVSLPLMKHGFYYVEEWGCWLQQHALLLIKVLDTQKDLIVNINLKCYYPDHRKTLSIYANGKLCCTYDSTTQTNKINFTVSKLNIPSNGIISLEFVTDIMESPLKLGESQDERKLGFGLTELQADGELLTFGLDVDLFQAIYHEKKHCSFQNEEWQDYFKTHDIKKEVAELKKGMPQDSQQLIDEFLIRRQEPYIFSGFEIQQHNKVMAQDLSQYQIANKTGFQPEVFYFKNGLKFLDEAIIKHHLQNKDVIDGGACSGDSALMFSQYNFVHKIYAFEPIKESFNGLKKTLKLNHCTKAEAIHAAISDKDGTAMIMGEQCKTTTIDTFAQDKKIGCIKFDLEGMETVALQGAIETIKRDKPLLLICLYHKPLDFFKIKATIEALSLGYKFMVKDTEPCNEMIGIHLMLIAYQNTRRHNV